MAVGRKADFHQGAEKARTRQSGLSKEKSESRLRPYQPSIRCPECSSHRTWRDGLRHTTRREVQRYLCRRCGYRFSEPKIKLNIPSQVLEGSEPVNDLTHDFLTNLDPSLKESVDEFPFFRSEDVGSHKPTLRGKQLNTYRDCISTRRVCVSEREAKNLAKVEPLNKRPAGASKQITGDVKERIFQFAWWLKKQGYAETTIKGRVKLLRVLVKRRANLYDPESIKEVIANQSWSPGRKNLAVVAYDSYLKMVKGSWNPPKYKTIKKLPFIPSEEEIDQVIAGSNNKTATFLQLLKETGMRSGEA